MSRTIARMSTMDDLIAFVRAQLDDDERVAREAVDQGGIGRGGERYWTRCYSDRRALIGDQSGNVVVHGISETWSPSSYQAEHITRWDPARVLAEVEAKRRILAMHAESDFPHDPDSPGPGNYSWTAQCNGCYEDAPCPTVRLLAQPYAGRPGWHDEWAT